MQPQRLAEIYDWHATILGSETCRALRNLVQSGQERPITADQYAGWCRGMEIHGIVGAYAEKLMSNFNHTAPDCEGFVTKKIGCRHVFERDGYVYKVDYRNGGESCIELKTWLETPNESLCPIEYVDFMSIPNYTDPTGGCYQVMCVVMKKLDEYVSENRINEYFNYQNTFCEYVWYEWDKYEENPGFPECAYILYDDVRIDDAHINNFRGYNGHIFMIDYAETTNASSWGYRINEPTSGDIEDSSSMQEDIQAVMWNT